MLDAEGGNASPAGLGGCLRDPLSTQPPQALGITSILG